MNKKRKILLSLFGIVGISAIGGAAYYVLFTDNSVDEYKKILSSPNKTEDDDKKNILRNNITKTDIKRGASDIEQARKDKNENDIAVIIKSRYSNVWKEDATVKWRSDLNLFEFINGLNVLYITADGNSLIQGHIFDINTGLDYTDQTLAKISKIDTSKLPIKDAIKIINGDGKDTLYVFGYLDDNLKNYYRSVLDNYNNVTIYVFLNKAKLNTNDDSYTKNYKEKIYKDIQCSNDKAREFSNYLRASKLVSVTERIDDCQKYLSEQYDANKIFNDYKISWSPTIFTVNGNRYKSLPDYQLKVVIEKDSKPENKPTNNVNSSAPIKNNSSKPIAGSGVASQMKD